MNRLYVYRLPSTKKDNTTSINKNSFKTFGAKYLNILRILTRFASPISGAYIIGSDSILNGLTPLIIINTVSKGNCMLANLN